LTFEKKYLRDTKRRLPDTLRLPLLPTLTAPPRGKAVRESEGRHATHQSPSLTEIAMNRFASTFAYAGTVTAATLAAVLMSGNALAESPTIDTTPFISTLSRAEVRAEVLRARDQVSAAGTEWAMQQNERQPIMAGLSRAQVTAEYIAARDQVHAMNAEDSGSSHFAQSRVYPAGTTIAGSSLR
jgi:hypothetical protein